MINRILFLLLITLTSCGYQPLYSKKETKTLIVNELELIGDANINKSIISALSINVDKNMLLTNKVILENKKTIVETSKNKKGQPDSFKMIIDVKFLLTDNGNISNEKFITEEFSYKNKENKFDLSQYETNIEQNLINKIIEKLIFYINV
tara:strand:- start:4445 stop:4894 length:450 start_codon:yes stop_codon:yes gene_type:complete